ncbi:MAG: hypothetical protein ABIS50_24400 [Luteolibacter sp.]|uniref:hypothetical protein n=1 Tax=Luteolibacter sp. TaxID=1962973 RepID=UPI00326369BB
MKILTAVFMLAVCQISLAEPASFEEQNFSIDLPAGWTKGETPPQCLALVRSTDGAKGMVLMAFKIPPEEITNALTGLVRGAKNAALAKNLPFTNEHDQVIDGVGFHFYSSVQPGNVGTVSMMGVTGNWGYSVQGFSSNLDPSKDPEITTAMNSFRLLAPVPDSATSPITSSSQGEAYQAGQFFGKWAVIAFIAGAVVIIFRKAAAAKRG